MNVEWSKIETHQQIYCDSCIPSAVEMVLKLNSKIKEDYYSLQVEQYRKLHIENKPMENLKYRSFDYIRDQKYYCGLEFAKFTRYSDKPIEELFHIIDKELNEDRYVIISLQNLNGFGFHMWIIYDHDKNNGDYKYFTKNHGFIDPILYNNLRERINYMAKENIDILTYKIAD